MRPLLPLAAGLLLLLMSGPLRADVVVTAAWARASILADRPGAAYLTVSSAAGDRLIGVTTPAAANVVLHVTRTGVDGVARMTHVDALELPAGETVALAPGGAHLMLMGLRERLVEGATIRLTLRFERAGEVDVAAPVLGVAARGPEG